MGSKSRHEYHPKSRIPESFKNTTKHLEVVQLPIHPGLDGLCESRGRTALTPGDEQETPGLTGHP
jgi:hypothetical protein